MDAYQIAFGVMLGIGLLLLLLSWIFGDIADMFGGDFDGGGDGDGPSWTSMSVIAAALVGFGGSGLTGLGLGLNGLPAVFVGIAVGLLFAFCIMQFVLKPLSKQQANTAISQRTYIGSQAIVTLDVSWDRPGRVQFTDDNGAIVEITAVPSNRGQQYTRGDTVIIDGVVSNTAHITASDIL